MSCVQWLTCQGYAPTPGPDSARRGRRLGQTTIAAATTITAAMLCLKLAHDQSRRLAVELDSERLDGVEMVKS